MQQAQLGPLFLVRVVWLVVALAQEALEVPVEQTVLLEPWSYVLLVVEAMTAPVLHQDGVLLVVLQYLAALVPCQRAVLEAMPRQLIVVVVGVVQRLLAQQMALVVVLASM